MHSHHSPESALLLAAPLACGDNGADTHRPTTAAGTSTSSASSGEPTPTTGAAESSTGLDPPSSTLRRGDVRRQPARRPLYDPEKGGIQGALQANYVLHTTQIYLKPEGAQEFGELAEAVGAEAANTEGLIAFSVGSDNGCGVARTMGIWASEEAMYKLVTSEAHAKAMAA
jgi:heme-degrading monooxygenase HmoA